MSAQACYSCPCVPKIFIAAFKIQIYRLQLVHLANGVVTLSCKLNM